MVIVILMDSLPDAPGIRISPRVMFPHPVTAVGVAVAVAVDVAVAVFVGVKVAVGVLEGSGVAVLVGSGVNVTGSPEKVAVGVFEAGIVVSVGVFDATGVEDDVAVGPDPEPDPDPGFDPTSMNPMIVRALEEVKVCDPNGTRLTRGL